MLELRPNCECCGVDLPPDSPNALMCSFECTFCTECNGRILHDRCPNCAGELKSRPIRPAKMLEKFPASTERVLKADGCVDAAA